MRRRHNPSTHPESSTLQLYKKCDFSSLRTLPNSRLQIPSPTKRTLHVLLIRHVSVDISSEEIKRLDSEWFLATKNRDAGEPYVIAQEVPTWPCLLVRCSSGAADFHLPGRASLLGWRGRGVRGTGPGWMGKGGGSGRVLPVRQTGLLRARIYA